MKIISYNVNGIRAAIKKGWVDWVSAHDFDVICIQETKARPEQVDVKLFEDCGYTHHWVSAEKKGYSGVCILSRIKADKIVEGMGVEEYDREGRIIRMDIGDVSILNCYFPSGTSGELRQAVKYRFLDDFYSWISELQKERKNLIICGDYNIANTPMDIHDPVRNKKSSGFLPEERAWLSKFYENGYTDSFRFLNPDKIEYSWWSYRAQARANNKGWRIDYISVTDNLRSALNKSYHMADAVHSDHCPVFLELNI
jgi:exodeoxyribonuclease-3